MSRFAIKSHWKVLGTDARIWVCSATGAAMSMLEGVGHDDPNKSMLATAEFVAAHTYEDYALTARVWQTGDAVLSALTIGQMGDVLGEILRLSGAEGAAKEAASFRESGGEVAGTDIASNGEGVRLPSVESSIG